MAITTFSLTRREFILSAQNIFATRYLARSVCVTAIAELTGCGGGGGTGLSTTNPVLSIAASSQQSPSALSPLYLTTTNVDQTHIFSLTLNDAAGNPVMALTPIRIAADGAVVVALPINFEGSTGQTSGYACIISLTQNGVTATTTPITVTDLPTSAQYGLSLGQASRNLYISQELTYARTLNILQALPLVPGFNVDTTLLQAHIATQLKNTITARNDVDRMIVDSNTSISAGTLADGTAINYTAASTNIQDRIVIQYLLSYINTNQSTLVAADSSVHQLGLTSFTSFPALFTSMTSNIGSVAVSIKSAQVTQNASDSSALDQALSALTASSAILTTGTQILAIATTALAAPEIAAAGVAAAAVVTIAGMVIGTISVANDLYDVYTVFINPTASLAQKSAQVAQTLSDFASTLLAADGFSGGTVQSITSSIVNPLMKDAALGASVLVGSTAALYTNSTLPADSNTASAAADSPVSSGLASVNGTVSVANSQGSVLSALTGVSLTSGEVSVSSIADPSGNYSLLFPVGSPGVNYSAFTFSAFDPLTGVILNTTAIDLANVAAGSTLTGPSLITSCSDYDASTPDSDDPDCD